MVEEAESVYLTKLNELRDAIEQGKQNVESGKACQFTGDEFANYLSERANQIAQKKPDA